MPGSRGAPLPGGTPLPAHHSPAWGAAQGCPESIPTPRILPAGRVPESVPALIGFSSPSHPTSSPVIAEGVARATQRLPQSTKGTDEAGPARPTAMATALPDPRTQPQPCHTAPVRGQSPQVPLEDAQGWGDVAEAHRGLALLKLKL